MSEKVHGKAFNILSLQHNANKTVSRSLSPPHPAGMASIMKTNNAGRGAGREEVFHAVSRNVNNRNNVKMGIKNTNRITTSSRYAISVLLN